MEETQEKKKGRLYYGWIVLGYCMILTACSTGILTYLNALFVDSVPAALGVSRATYMLYSTCCTVTSMLVLPMIGKVFQLFKVKRLLLLGTACGAGALLLYGVATSVYLFYLGGILSGLAMCLMGALPMTLIINNWFIEKRGLVTGIAFMGSALSSALLSPIVSRLISNYNYHVAYYVLAALMILLMVPTTLFILKISPKEKGLEPYGIPEEGQKKEPQGFGYLQILKAPAFWCFSVSVFILGMVCFGAQSQLVAYWKSLGVEAAVAASLYSLMMYASAAAKMLLGNVYDRIGIAKGSAVFFSLGLLALISLLTCTSGWLLVIPALLFGMMTSLQVMVPSFVVNRLFGEKAYGSVFGIVNTLLFCGVAVGVPLNAVLYDYTGGYRLSWIVFTILLAVSMAAVLTANKLSIRMYKKEFDMAREA